LEGLLLSGIPIEGIGLGVYSKTPVEKATRIALGEALKFILSQIPSQYFHYSEEKLLSAEEKPAK
jgi:hypothetical protein